MKKFNKPGPMSLRRLVGNLLTQRRNLAILAVAGGLLAASSAIANEINLVTGTSGAVASGSFSGGTFPTSASDLLPPDAIYELIDTLPAGTGVFQPFLSYQRRDTEQGVNTSSFGNGQGLLDDKRVPQWTHDVRFGDLGTITRGGVSYFAFELDANETGSGQPNRLLSIDDIRIIVTASSPFAGAQNENQAFDRLRAIDTPAEGLVYAQNDSNGALIGTPFIDPTSGSSSYPNWVLIDASRRTEGSTSGSGSSDMLVLIPTALFPSQSTHANDLLTFYTRNGVHDTSGDDGSDAGFEEWRFLGGAAVPDGGSTLLLLGSALIPLGLLRARREMSSKA